MEKLTESKHERTARLIRASLGKPGDTLPSEAEFVRMYDVSRQTVRQALATLEAEGLITSSQGTLRTVRDHKRWLWNMTEWERAHSNAADAWANTIRAQGGTPHSDIQVGIVQASTEVANALDIEEGDPIYTRSRLRSVNGEPHQLSDSFFPGWLTEEAPLLIRPGDVATNRGLLADSGHPQVRFHDTLTARMPTTDEAQQLRMLPGTPLLVHTRIGFGEHGRPVRYMVTRMAANSVEIEYDVEA